jgi:integrase
VRWNEEGADGEVRYLMRENPIRGFAIPKEQNPRRPVATQDRYEAILAKAHAVHPFLPALLTVANGTGRRITAVCRLRYENLQLAKTKATPHGAIAWPEETDKMGRAWSAPISATVRAALDALLSARPGLGRAYLFPSPKSAHKPVSRWLASAWLRHAEQVAEVPKQDGSLWHAYRRKWGTERKHLPIQDVAQAGGWKNTATLQTIYQQPDDATLYRVVSEPAELREVKA